MNDAAINDAAIVERVKEGDREAYGKLVHRYQNAVYGLAYHHLRNAEDARDAAQEALLQAYLRLEQLREPERFGAWVRQITVNQCHMLQRRQQPTDALDNVTSISDKSVSDTTRQIETRLGVQQALACLSQASRLTLTLYYFHSYSLQEIADFLEVPVTTIKSRLRNARARMHKELQEMMEETLKPEPLPPHFAIRLMHNLTSSGSVHSLSFSPDGRLLANTSLLRIGSSRTTELVERDLAPVSEVQIRDARSGKLLRTLQAPHLEIMEDVAFSPDGKLLACGSRHRVNGSLWNGEVQLWEVSTGTLQQTFIVPDSIVRTVAFSPDGSTIASGSRRYDEEIADWDCEVQLWDVATGEVRRRWPAGYCFLDKLTFAPDGRTLAASIGRKEARREGESDAPHPRNDWQVQTWDSATGEPVRAYQRPHAIAESDIAFSPDIKMMAAGDGPEGNILVWNVVTGSLIRTLSGHSGTVWAVTFSPDGRVLASCGQEVKLWDAVTGELLRTIDEQVPVSAGAFSPDSRTFASAEWQVGANREKGCKIKMWTVQ